MVDVVDDGFKSIRHGRLIKCSGESGGKLKKSIVTFRVAKVFMFPYVGVSAVLSTVLIHFYFRRLKIARLWIKVIKNSIDRLPP
jgi:hypothetical protein